MNNPTKHRRWWTTRPRGLFAIVHEYGDRVDAEVAGWGLCFADRAIAFNDEGVTVSMRSVENAVRLFQGGPNVTAHLCWPGPPAR